MGPHDLGNWLQQLNQLHGMPAPTSGCLGHSKRQKVMAQVLESLPPTHQRENKRERETHTLFHWPDVGQPEAKHLGLHLGGANYLDRLLLPSLVMSKVLGQKQVVQTQIGITV